MISPRDFRAVEQYFYRNRVPFKVKYFFLKLPICSFLFGGFCYQNNHYYFQVDLSDKILSFCGQFCLGKIINYLSWLQVLMNDVQSEVDAQMMQDVYSNDLKDTLAERSTTVRRPGS